jgi:hypothetical protein
MLQPEAVLQTSDKLLAAAQKTIFSPDHKVPVDLELGSNQKVPLIFYPFVKRVFNRGVLIIVQRTINGSQDITCFDSSALFAVSYFACIDRIFLLLG